MRPGEIAQVWGKQHPEFSGVLAIKKETPRGRGGRLGTKMTIYHYVVIDGRAKRRADRLVHRDLQGDLTFKPFNGYCDVTGQLHLNNVLNWYYVDHPRKGVRHEWRKVGEKAVVYRYAYFVTTSDVATKMGAKKGRPDDNDYWQGWHDEQHPEYPEKLHSVSYDKMIDGDKYIAEEGI